MDKQTYNTNHKQIRPAKVRKLLPEMPVRAKFCGNVTEILHSSKESSGVCGIIKVSKRYYRKRRDSDVGKGFCRFYSFKATKSRSENLRVVSHSITRGRDLINANITNPNFCKFLTLTYKENMTDTKKLYNDFKNFNRDLRNSIGDYEYITAAEPQARGAWHLHVILIFDREVEFIHWSIFEKAWRKKGAIHIRALDNVDNVGAYLAAYLTDMLEDDSNLLDKEVGSCKEVVEKKVDGVSKRVLKAGRLWRYPAGFHIFRWSKGIKKPVVEKITYKEAKEKAGCCEPTYKKSLSVLNGHFENVLTYEYYNRLRPDGQSPEKKKSPKNKPKKS